MKTSSICFVLVWGCALALTACTSPMLTTSGLSRAHLARDENGMPYGNALYGVPYYLPRTVLPITVKGDFVALTDDKKPKPEDQEFVVTVTASDPIQVADPSAPELLVYHTEGISDDNFNLSVNAKGLLSTVELKSKDQSAQVPVLLATIAKDIFEASAGAPFFVAAKAGGGETPPVSGDARRTACSALLQKFEIHINLDLSVSSTTDGDRLLYANSFRLTQIFLKSGGAAGVDKAKYGSDHAYADYIDTMMAAERTVWVWERRLDASLVSSSFDPKEVELNVARNIIPQLPDRYTAAGQSAAAIEAIKNAIIKDRGKAIAKPNMFVFSFTDTSDRAAGGSLTPAGDPLTGAISDDGVRGPGVLFRGITPRDISVDINPALLSFINGDGSANACEIVSGRASLNLASQPVADTDKPFLLDTSRTAFVEKSVNMTVQDGILLGVKVDKPSSVIAALSIPVEVLKVIMSIPGELLANLKTENGISAEHVATLQAEIDLLTKQQALVKARADAAAAAVGTPPTTP